MKGATTAMFLLVTALSVLGTFGSGQLFNMIFMSSECCCSHIARAFKIAVEIEVRKCV